MDTISHSLTVIICNSNSDGFKPGTGFTVKKHAHIQHNVQATIQYFVIVLQSLQRDDHVNKQ